MRKEGSSRELSPSRCTWVSRDRPREPCTARSRSSSGWMPPGTHSHCAYHAGAAHRSPRLALSRQWRIRAAVRRFDWESTTTSSTSPFAGACGSLWAQGGRSRPSPPTCHLWTMIEDGVGASGTSERRGWPLHVSQPTATGNSLPVWSRKRHNHLALLISSDYCRVGKPKTSEDEASTCGVPQRVVHRHHKRARWAKEQLGRCAQWRPEYKPFPTFTRSSACSSPPSQTTGENDHAVCFADKQDVTLTEEEKSKCAARASGNMTCAQRRGEPYSPDRVSANSEVGHLTLQQRRGLPAEETGSWTCTLRAV